MTRTLSRRQCFSLFAGVLMYTYRLTPIAADSAFSPEEAIVRAQNQERKKSGVRPLRWHPTLAEAAKARRDDMLSQGYVSHDDPDGAPGKYYQVLTAEGVTGWSFAGENIEANNCGVMQEAVAQAIQSWLASPPHYANITDPDFTACGVSCGKFPPEQFGGSWLFVVVFAGGLL